jgi:hypothetical protein
LCLAAGFEIACSMRYLLFFFKSYSKKHRFISFSFSVLEPEKMISAHAWYIKLQSLKSKNKKRWFHDKQDIPPFISRSFLLLFEESFHFWTMTLVLF